MFLNKGNAALGVASLTLLLVPATGVQAQPPERLYGVGAPFSISELPPGRFRYALESMSEQARQTSMSWLHSFSFPAKDMDYLHFDAQGGVFYADSYLPDATETASVEPGTSAMAADPNTVFSLHSKPGASKIVYLDFDGHLVSGTAWSSADLRARAYDLDGSPSTFSAHEAAQIAEIWQRVAEDYAPYDIDVTTQDPASLGISFGPQVARVLITRNTDETGAAMPSSSSGGVAYVNVWGRSDYTKYSPAFVYYNNLLSGTTYIAEAASHEFGHNLGLGHDGSATAAYYSGDGADSSLVSWAPIMGSSYYKNVTQWSKGEYSGANNPQDDLAVIDAKLNYRLDDHGDQFSSATALNIGAGGSVTATNPETDAYNDQPDNKGIVGRHGAQRDVDVFYFDAGDGPLSLTVTPAWDAFYRSARRGANLDIKVTLSNSQGQVLAVSDPQDDTQAALSLGVAAGRYYLSVEGVGNSQAPYSDYASLGQYYIRGNVTPSGVSQNVLPVAAFSTRCAELDCGFTDTSSDSDGSVVNWSWNFGDGVTSSVQHPTHSYAAGGSFDVVLTVADDQGAVSSSVQRVTVTDPNAVAPGVPSGVAAANNADATALISWGSQTPVVNYEVQRQKRHQKNGRWTGTATVATVTAPATSVIDSSGTGIFRYSVRAVNVYGASSWSAWAQVSVTGSSGTSDGGGKKCNPRKQACL